MRSEDRPRVYDCHVGPAVDLVEGHVSLCLVTLFVLLPENEMLLYDGLDRGVGPEVAVENLALELATVLRKKGGKRGVGC